MTIPSGRISNEPGRKRERKKEEREKQAGAELCQAQVKLGLAKPGQLRLNFKFRYFPGGVGGGGWVREIENKAKLSPAGAGAWAELGKKSMIIVVPSCLKDADGARTRSDQNQLSIML